MFTLAGTRALVTGGSRGIGLASAEALAKAGCDVVLNHVDDGARAEVECERLSKATGRSIYHIDADVGEKSAARTMVEKAAALLDGLEIVHCNAGICRFTPFLEIDDENWQRHLDVNLSGGFRVAQSAAKLMVEQKQKGRIIFTTSVGAFRSNATQTHYCATKAGLHLLAQGMALELGGHGITVNCVAPGWIHTDINDEQSRDEDAVKRWVEANCSVGRLGKPSDLQSAILFLASKEAEYVNGTTITVDGGWNAQL
ncbi:MAG: SDR family NAD(P)-dependent oxidoreductase [Bacteroidota bacterium]